VSHRPRFRDQDGGTDRSAPENIARFGFGDWKRIEHLREEFALAVHDAVEMDYRPEDEDGIRAFLADADFDYAIGSVHELDGVNVHFEEPFAAKPEAERAALVESELFDVAAHPDLIERNRPLRGLADGDHYRAAAAAFADSRTVPELNAGRVTDEYGEFHPSPAFLDVLAEYDLSMSVGSDSHDPGDVAPAVDALRDRLREHGLEPVAPPGLD